MSVDLINGLDEEDVLRNFGHLALDPGTMRVEDCEDADQILRTKSAALSQIAQIPKLPARPELPPAIKDKMAFAKAHNMLSNYQKQLNEVKTVDDEFPFLAWESVKLGLKKEMDINAQLKTHVETAEKMHKDIDLLLDVSAGLGAMTGEVNELSDKMKDLFNQLKERGIDLLQGQTKLTKDKVSELKTLASSQVDKLRSNVQSIFATKIQTLIQAIGSIMEIIKDIVRNNSRLCNAANRLPGH